MTQSWQNYYEDKIGDAWDAKVGVAVGVLTAAEDVADGLSPGTSSEYSHFASDWLRENAPGVDPSSFAYQFGETTGELAPAAIPIGGAATLSRTAARAVGNALVTSTARTAAKTLDELAQIAQRIKNVDDVHQLNSASR